jgi:hypothetical protein
VLLQTLCRFQAEKGWSDGQMAATLGIARTVWNRTRRHKIPVGTAILRGTLRAFPQLRDATFAELEKMARPDEVPV